MKEKCSAISELKNNKEILETSLFKVESSISTFTLNLADG